MPAMFRYTGDSLASLVSEASLAATDRACRNIAEDTQRTMMHTAQSATPVLSGAMHESWLAPMVEHRGAAWRARIQNPHWAAWMIEHGAQPHEIKPDERKAEITPEGPRADVHHPGFQGSHMTAKAGAMAEATLPWVGQRRLHDFVADLELAIEVGKHA